MYDALGHTHTHKKTKQLEDLCSLLRPVKQSGYFHLAGQFEAVGLVSCADLWERFEMSISVLKLLKSNLLLLKCQVFSNSNHHSYKIFTVLYSSCFWWRL